MIWINNFFLFMSLSGSIALLLYYLAKAVFGRFLSAGCRYLLLKICMCFYLLPIPLLSSEIRSVIRIFFPGFSYGVNPWDVWIPMDYSTLIYDTPDGYAFPGFSWPAMLVLAGWLAIGAGILLIQYKNYRKMKQLTKHTAVPSARFNKLSGQLEKNLKLHRKITIYSLDEKFPPFCYGIFHPRVILSSEYETKEAELILRHELQHIKALDFLFRIIALLIIALHFFNPLAYLLSYEIGKASELACDEKVLKNCPKEQQSLYGDLLLNTTVTSPLYTFTNSFSGNNKKTMKERIFMMKHPKKTKFAAFICCTALTVFCSTLPAAAYEPPQVEENDSYHSDDMEGDYMFSTSETAPYTIEDSWEAYFSTSDCFFVDEEGNFENLAGSYSPQAICSHTYVSGYLYQHTPNAKGGCTYKKYSVKKCSKCGALKDKTLISSTTYTVCPHK